VETINQAEKTLSERGIFCRPLHTSHAFHSHMMEPIVNQFVDLMSTIKLHAPKIPYLSNVTGDWITDREATDPRYWGRHLRGTVQFAASFDTLFKDGPHVLLEVGPGETLLTFARQCAGANSESAFVWTILHQSAQQSDTFLSKDRKSIGKVCTTVKVSIVRLCRLIPSSGNVTGSIRRPLETRGLGSARTRMSPSGFMFRRGNARVLSRREITTMRRGSCSWMNVVWAIR
jgi:acyl transferase domain-containing protein